MCRAFRCFYEWDTYLTKPDMVHKMLIFKNSYNIKIDKDWFVEIEQTGLQRRLKSVTLLGEE